MPPGPNMVNAIYSLRRHLKWANASTRPPLSALNPRKGQRCFGIHQTRGSRSSPFIRYKRQNRSSGFGLRRLEPGIRVVNRPQAKGRSISSAAAPLKCAFRSAFEECSHNYRLTDHLAGLNQAMRFQGHFGNFRCQFLVTC